MTIDEVDSELMNHILMVIKKIHSLLKEKLNIEGLTIVQNNDLGQEVKHLHFHLIPRYKDDDWKTVYNQNIIKNVTEIQKEIIG